MRSLRGEVMLNMPAAVAWEMYRNNEIVSKIYPKVLSRAEYVRGDGSPGSLRLLKLGPAVSNYVKESTQRIEKVEAGRSVSYTVTSGDLKNMYDPYRVTFSFSPVPSREGENCKAEWKADYEPLNPNVPPPDQAKDTALKFLRAFDKFNPSL